MDNDIKLVHGDKYNGVYFDPSQNLHFIVINTINSDSKLADQIGLYSDEYERILRRKFNASYGDSGLYFVYLEDAKECLDWATDRFLAFKLAGER